MRFVDPTRQIVMTVPATFADIYLRHFFRSSNPVRHLRVARKTCLTGPLEYKDRVIFVLVLDVVCTLGSAVG